jgi:GAF domain-containing protein
VLELLPGGQALLLRAGVGWQEGLVGELTVSADPATSQAGYTLLQGGPVIVEELRIDPRFDGPPLLTDHGVVSGVSTIIPGPVDVYGVVGTHTRTRRVFTQDDVNFLQAVANVLGEAIERQRVQQEVEERARQQAAVAGLGQRALGEVDLDTLMDEATRLVCETLGLDYCKVLELLPGGTEMLLRTGYGWKEGLVGTRKVGAQRGSHGGYTLMSSHPVIFDDLPSETRFEESLLNEHKVISGLSVVIGGQDRPFGTLGAHSTERRRFTEDDINFLQTVANVWQRPSRPPHRHAAAPVAGPHPRPVRSQPPHRAGGQPSARC